MLKESDKIYSITYKVDTNYVNFNKKLGLYGTLGLIQDVASEHAEILGFGYQDMLDRNIFWVLTRQKLVMNRWPDWRDNVKVVTWTKPVEGFNAFREFELFIGDDKIGECTTTWMILDGVTRRPTKPAFDDNDKFARMDYGLEIRAGRVKAPEEMSKAGVFKVHNSDIDMNQHVNNTRYSKWILDSIPMEYHKTLNLKEFEINFLGETFLDDDVTIMSVTEDESSPEKVAFYTGLRESDNRKVFAARLVAIDK